MIMSSLGNIEMSAFVFLLKMDQKTTKTLSKKELR
jgi:hypothetical protein